jgi:TonB-linked SusC/RagA family outer membrane protein
MDYEARYSTDFSPAVPDPTIYSWEGSTVNSLAKRADDTTHWIADFLLNYNLTLNENHKISALLGYSMEENKFESLTGSILGTPNNSIRFLNAGDPETQLNSNRFTDWSFSSIFSRVGYTYKNKYSVNGTIRRDGTSRLTEENRYGVFTAASLGWTISEEDFFNKEGLVNNLKLRASIGTLGNVLSLGNYPTTSILSSQGTVLNQGISQGYTQTAAINQDITWERATKSNFGIDALLASGNIYTSLDYFVEETTDQLFVQPIPQSNGFSSNPRINSGAVKNSGFELQLGFRDNTAKDWSYDVNFNLATVKNEVSDLGGRDDEFLANGLKVGEPVNSFFGFQTNGLITDASQLTKYQEGPFSSKDIGDIDIVDTNMDGLINGEDRTIIGNRFPNLTYGMISTVNYKNWSFQVQVQGVQGRDIYIGSRNSTDLTVLMSSWARNEDARVFNRFHPVNNPNGTWPRVTKDDRGSNTEISDFWLEDASFLRINNIYLSYNLPTEVLSKIGIGGLSIYGSINNAYTFTKYDGPEVDTTSGDRGTINALSSVPNPRTFTLGIKASF